MEQDKDGRSGADAPSGHQPSASAVPASQSGVPNAGAYVRRLERAVIELSEGDLNDRDGVSADTEMLVDELAERREEIMR